MFPRIKKTRRGDRCYEYLVVSESVRGPSGQSSTKDLATLGNVSRFSQAHIKGLIDGLIRLFEINEYALSDQVEILRSLEHGSIVLWRKLWQRLGLPLAVREGVKNAANRVNMDVEKYVEMMVINRCVNPRSKLATSRWVDTTCYRQLRGYDLLPRDIHYFYRSMDYLLKAKEAIEKAVYERLQNLFSINVRLTFYDITSTFFYGGKCSLADNGYSRDNQPDKVQIVIGVVTSYEGYPLKHWVFEGNRQDQSTVAEVVRDLRHAFNIEDTIFVGDRGMISRLNLDRIQGEGYDYIMGVKARQSEVMTMVLEDDGLFGRTAITWKDLKLADRRLPVKDFISWKCARILDLTPRQERSRGWKDLLGIISDLDNTSKVTVRDFRQALAQLRVTDSQKRRRLGLLLKKYQGRYADTVRLVCVRNPERARLAARRRREKIEKLSKELTELFAAKPKDVVSRFEQIFAGYNQTYRRYFKIKWVDMGSQKQTAERFEIDQGALEEAKRYDGVFVLNTSRMELSPEKVVASYKNLQEVEMLFDDLKHFVDIRPVRHWLPHRVCAHVFLCILALLLKRVLEIDCLGGKAVTQTLETVAESKLVNYRVRMSERSSRTKEFWKVTTTTPQQAQCFAAVGVKNPQCLEEYVW